MIVSASRRTDIPALYSEWFINRINEGYALVKNPFNRSQIRKVLFDEAECFVFFTKDPENMIDKLKIIDNKGYKYYFQFTLNPYDNIIEKGLREKSQIEDTFLNLSNVIGKEKVLWRYDPIIINDFISIEYHKHHFIRLLEKLKVNSVIISFVDMYKKIKTSLIRNLTDDEIIELCEFFKLVSKEYGITIKTCCETIDHEKFNLKKSSCVDKELIERIIGKKNSIQKDRNQRRECFCIQSVDIGAYNTCTNNCIYCYANYSMKSILKNVSNMDVKGEFLN